MVGELKKISELTQESNKELMKDIETYSDGWVDTISEEKVNKLASKYGISVKDLEKHIKEIKEGYISYLEEMRDKTLSMETYR